jgi:hypothetical protein
MCTSWRRGKEEREGGNENGWICTYTKVCQHHLPPSLKSEHAAPLTPSFNGGITANPHFQIERSGDGTSISISSQVQAATAAV